MSDELAWLFSSAWLMLTFSGMVDFLRAVSLMQILLVLGGLVLLWSGLQRRVRLSGIFIFFLGLLLFALGVGSILNRQPVPGLVPWGFPS